MFATILAAMVAKQEPPAVILRRADRFCRAPFTNGQLLDGAFTPAPNMPELRVRNGTKETAIVRLQKLDAPDSATMYLEKGGSATIRYIPAGLYEVRVAYSATIASDCVTVTSASSAYEFEDTFEFEIVTKETVTERGILTEMSWTVGEVTLFVTEDGNAETEEIPLAEFNRQ